jgi:hypothetical protein
MDVFSTELGIRLSFVKTSEFLGGGLCLMAWCKHHATRHNTPIHNILLAAPQLSFSQMALGKLFEDSIVIPKHVGTTIQD